MTTLYGQRIRLRAAERSDLPLFTTWLADPQVTENLMVNQPMSLASEEIWFENMLKRPAREQVLVIEALQAADDPGEALRYVPIGNTSFNAVEEPALAAEIGIFIGEKTYWNRGFGTETMGVMLGHGFENRNCQRSWLRVFAPNLRAIRAYEKAGFTHEGKFREGHYQHGSYVDVLIMSVLRQEWDLAQTQKG